MILKELSPRVVRGCLLGVKLKGLHRRDGGIICLLQYGTQVADERVPRVGAGALVIECRLGEPIERRLVLSLGDTLDAPSRL